MLLFVFNSLVVAEGGAKFSVVKTYETRYSLIKLLAMTNR